MPAVYATEATPTGSAARDVASPLYHCVAYLAARTSKICTVYAAGTEAFRSPGAVDVRRDGDHAAPGHSIVDGGDARHHGSACPVDERFP